MKKTVKRGRPRKSSPENLIKEIGVTKVMIGLGVATMENHFETRRLRIAFWMLFGYVTLLSLAVFTIWSI